MGKGLKWVSVWTTLGMFLVLLMGALVTKTGSGNGCGNTWPLCHGKFAPLASPESLIEYSHRAVSGAVGILVVVQAIWAWRKRKHMRGVKALSIAGVFFTVLQALLGAAAVVWQQSSAVLALHFGFSLAAFAAILLLTIILFDGSIIRYNSHTVISKPLKISIWAITIYSYGVVYLGAYVRHTKSGLGCLGWPTCNGKWIPELSGTTGIQFTHRVAAFILLVSVIWLFLQFHKSYRKRKDLYYGGIIALILTIFQVISGGVVVLTKLQLVPSLAHNIIISCLFGVLCFLCFQSLNKTHNKISKEG